MPRRIRGSRDAARRRARPAGSAHGLEPARARAYFVHSYALPSGPDTIATCDYGAPFAAIVSRGNFHGAQFHPERSATTGARLLANFIRLAS